MNILVTGHRGYIGTHLVPLLVTAGHQIQGCDLRDGQDYRDIRNQEFDCVIHLAALVSVRESFEEEKAYYFNNSYGVLDFLRNNHVKRFIFASTGGAMYGDSHLAKETDPVDPMSPYAASKRMGEMVVSRHPNHCILRLANVFGGDYSVRGEAAAHAHFETDNPIVVYGGDQTRDFIHVDVVCRAILTATTGSMRGTYNIGSGVETHIGDLAAFYSSTRGVPLVIQPAREGEVQHISLDCTRAGQDGLLPSLEHITG